MKEVKLVKALFMTSMVLAVLVGTVSAQVQPLSPGPGIVVDVSAMNDEVFPGETATYKVNVTSITTVTEHVVLSIDDPKPGWTYTFDPAEYDINPGETVCSHLSMAVPPDATPGDYYHDVNATATFMFIVESSIYTNVKTTVISFPKRVPTLTPFGIIALVGLLSVIAISKIRRRGK